MPDFADRLREYENPTSALSQRLATVASAIGVFLEVRTDELQVLSLGAADGRDILGVLAARNDSARVSTTLVESDATACRLAEAVAESRGLTVDVRQADPGLSDSVAGAVPADLVVLNGLLDELDDPGTMAVFGALPQLLKPRAMVVWSHGIEPVDRTVELQAWLSSAGCRTLSQYPVASAGFTVGATIFEGRPRPLETGRRWFQLPD